MTILMPGDGLTIPTVVKAPTETLDYGIDWSTWLGADTISSSTWTVPTGLVTGSVASTATTTSQFVGGGQLETDYEIGNTIVTAGGRTATRIFRMQVRKR